MLYAGAGIAGYFLVLRPLLIKIGILSDPARIATETRKTEQIDNEIKAQTDSGLKPTKSVQEWQTIADQIYQDLRYSALDDNKADAVYQAARVKNDLDFWILYKLFGKRREYLFGIPSGGLMDLPQFIRSNVSTDKIAQLNWNYQNKGIKFRY